MPIIPVNAASSGFKAILVMPFAGNDAEVWVEKERERVEVVGVADVVGGLARSSESASNVGGAAASS